MPPPLSRIDTSTRATSWTRPALPTPVDPDLANTTLAHHEHHVMSSILITSAILDQSESSDQAAARTRRRAGRPESERRGNRDRRPASASFRRASTRALRGPVATRPGGHSSRCRHHRDRLRPSARRRRRSTDCRQGPAAVPGDRLRSAGIQRREEGVWGRREDTTSSPHISSRLPHQTTNSTTPPPTQPAPTNQPLPNPHPRPVDLTTLTVYQPPLIPQGGGGWSNHETRSASRGGEPTKNHSYAGKTGRWRQDRHTTGT